MDKKLKKALAALLCLSMITAMGGTGVFSEDAPAEEETSAEDSASEDEEDSDDGGSTKNTAPPRTPEEALADMELVTSKGKLKLYMNAKEHTLALEDTRSGEVWFSNPVDLHTSNAKSGQKDELSSGMTLIYGAPEDRATTIMTSKGKGGTDMKKVGDAIEISYTYQVEDKSDKTLKDTFIVPVRITLEEDYMKLYVNTSEISEFFPSTVNGKIITNLAFMTTFGAAGMNDEGYFVVPDGSGAIINFNNGKTGLKTYSGKVYGRDITAVKTTKQSSVRNVNLPVYGIVKKNGGLMVVADKGDTCATINSYVSNQNNTDYNSTYFDFELRTADEYLMGGESNPLKVFEKRGILIPEIEIRYYPVEATNDSTGYVKIADAYRDYLIKEKGVTDKDLTGNSSLYIDFFGGTLKKESVAGLPVTVKEPVTTFATAQYILENLTQMGVDDMVVAYNGYNDDNVGEHIADSFSPASKLGGSGKYKKLKKYSEANNIKLFPVIDNQQFKTGNGYWNMTNTAIRVSNAYSQIPVYDLAHGIENKYYKSLSLFSPASYNRAFSKFIKNSTKKGSTNFSFGSLANTIYGDYGRKALSRENSKGIVQEIYSSAKVSGSVLSDNPAAYVLPYTDYITNVPVNSSKFDVFDEEIPFYQMVMHGVTPYSSIAVNSDPDLGDVVLRAIASGSNVSFDMVGVEASELKDTKLDKYYYAYYANWVNEASELYKLFDEVLSPVADANITNYEVERKDNEVYKITTSYSNGKQTVVNFEKLTIEAGGKTYNLADYIGKEVIGE